jgi:hypothetical protein
MVTEKVEKMMVSFCGSQQMPLLGKTNTVDFRTVLRSPSTPSSQSREACSTTKSVAGSKLFITSTSHRVLVFKDAPRLVFSGLTKAIGAPRELEKNIEEPQYFE